MSAKGREPPVSDQRSRPAAILESLARSGPGEKSQTMPFRAVSIAICRRGTGLTGIKHGSKAREQSRLTVAGAPQQRSDFSLAMQPSRWWKIEYPGPGLPPFPGISLNLGPAGASSRRGYFRQPCGMVKRNVCFD